MVRLGELVMILDLHRQGLTLSAIARQTGLDRKRVCCMDPFVVAGGWVATHIAKATPLPGSWICSAVPFK